MWLQQCHVYLSISPRRESHHHFLLGMVSEIPFPEKWVVYDIVLTT